MAADDARRPLSSTDQWSGLDLDNREFRIVKRLVDETNNSVFMTGRAGTGKSTFLRYIIAHTDKKSVILAPTGIAAVNVGGQTIHSFFRIPLKPVLPDDPDFSYRRMRERLKYSSSLIKLMREVQLIVIDEISMVRADIIDLIDRILRKFTGNMRTPFGGKQLLMVGDIFQLEPVVTGEARDVLGRAYPSFYFFNANVFREFRPVSVELQKIYRQGSDAAFAQLLDRVRVGQPTREDIMALNSRYCPDDPSLNSDEMVMTLTSQRNIAAGINEQRLNDLPGHLYEYEGEVKGTFNLDALPAEKVLRLKVNAQVIFVKNDVERRWVNGTIGRVEELDEESIKVRTDDGILHNVEAELWENIHYVYNEETKKVEEEVLGTFTQMPLRLAWAITIHKSQGLTFNNVIIDLGRGAFSAGMTYVALSRCCRLSGIRLRNLITPRDIFVKNAIMQYASAFNDSGHITRALCNAKADEHYAEAARLATADRWPQAAEALLEGLSLRDESSNPLLRRLVTRKLRAFDRLNDKIADLQGQLDRAAKMLREISDENVRMAEMLRREGCDPEGAKANLEKALYIDPGNWRAHVQMAYLQLEGGDVESADRSAFMADACAGGFVSEVCLVLSETARAQGDLIQALNQLLRIDEHLPKDKANIRRIADLYDELGDEESAKKYRKRLGRR